jgi:hypothetical protein
MKSDDRNGERITDLSYLVSICGEDHEFKTEMIETFLKNTPPLINDMKNYLIDSEWKMIGDIAHKMKPSFTFMGIHTAKKLILNIERQGRLFVDVSEIPTMVLELESICNEAFAELETELINVRGSITN